MSSNYDKKGVPGRKRRGPGYDKRFIKKIVAAIENGLPRREAVREHGMSRSALSDWMREYGSQAYHASKQGHLSLAQRRSVVRAIEEGRMTVSEAKLAHNLGWTPTIKKWLRDFKREKEELVSSNKIVMAKKEDRPAPDPDSKKALAEALKKLEEAELKVKALDTLIDIAEEQFKIAIRKKPGARQS